MATSTPLTDTLIRQLKATGTAYRKADGHGLFLDVTPKGKKVWRYRAKNVARTKSGQILMTLGEYPAVTLAEARQKRQELREQIAKGLDPRQVEKDRIQAEKTRQHNTFRKISAEWLQIQHKRIKVVTVDGLERKLRIHILPSIGERPITDITARDILELLLSVEKRSVPLARAVKAILTRIFSYAIQSGIVENNPAAGLITRDILGSHDVKHQASIDIGELPALMDALAHDNASYPVKAAMSLVMMLFMRSGELRNAEWQHINLKAGLWTVPAENTKKGREQVYPLPRQAVAILKELHRLTGTDRYVFNTGQDKPLGYETLRAVLLRMGFYGKMTIHGFRALATGWLDEQGYSRQAIERQLSHLEKGQTNQAYHRADYMDERREMLQAWADYLDSIKPQDNHQQTEKAA